MNKFKFTAACLGMIGLGGVIGYFVAKKTLINQYREDIESVREYYAQKLDELGVMPEGFDAVLLDEEDYAEERKEEEEEETYTVNVKGRPIINYNNPPLRSILNDPPEDEGDEEDEDEDEGEEEEEDLDELADKYVKQKTENKAVKPYVIDNDEYLDAPDDYERMVLYYYTKDRVLCEDDDEVIEDEEEIVGLDYEDVLSTQTTCWVRNDALGMVYEIHRVNDSYKQAVGDRIETPTEREFRRQGRRKTALDE